MLRVVLLIWQGAWVTTMYDIFCAVPFRPLLDFAGCQWMQSSSAPSHGTARFIEHLWKGSRKWLWSRTKNQPKEEVFVADIPRTSGGHSRIPRPKTSVRAVKILEKQPFSRGYPWPEGADVHDPKGFSKTSVRKTLGWIFVPYLIREKSREKLDTPAALPLFWPQGVVRGGGRGVYILDSPVGGILYPPPF